MIKKVENTYKTHSEKELQKTTLRDFRVGKVIKRKGNKLYVK